MEYVKLGHTGMDVSRLCLGCMSFGVAERWVHKVSIFLTQRTCIQTEQARKSLDGP